MDCAGERQRLVAEFSSLQRRVSRLVRGNVTKALGERRAEVSDLVASMTHHQRQVMLALAQDGPLAMGELARRLEITPSSATELVDRLVERAWVERSSHPTDRRTVVVQLTPPAQELAVTVKEAVGAGTAGLLSRLDDGELATLVDLLRKVTRNDRPDGTEELGRGPR